MFPVGANVSKPAIDARAGAFYFQPSKTAILRIILSISPRQFRTGIRATVCTLLPAPGLPILKISLFFCATGTPVGLFPAVRPRTFPCTRNELVPSPDWKTYTVPFRVPNHVLLILM